MFEHLTVASSPHAHSGAGVRKIMQDVVIALMPVTGYAVYQYGWNALFMVVACVASAVLAEWIWCAVARKPPSVRDGSAIVTGLILSLCLPPHFPVWMAACGGAFAILIVKMPYGGLGRNFMNPALAARAALMAAWPAAMTTWVVPRGAVLALPDAISGATPLAAMAQGYQPPLLSLAMGHYPGSLGETASLLLLLGALYLLFRGVIHWRIPLMFMATVVVLGYVAGVDGLRQLLTGGVMIGACFMATDYASSPIHPAAQWVFAAGCGIITMVIRLWGAYPEGVTYAILLMNVAAPLLDRLMAPRKYGEVRS